MKRWTIILLFCLLSLLFLGGIGIGAPGNKALEEKIVALEKKGWEAITKKDWNGLSSLLAEDFVEVGEMGIRGKSAAIEDLKANFTLKEYSMEDAKVLELGKDAGLLVYQPVQKGSYQGQDLPSKTNCSAAYVRRGGKWLNISFQQTAAK
jgi:uncharacterized protein DUF4440